MDTPTHTQKKQKLARLASAIFIALAVLWYTGALFTEGWRHGPNWNWLRRYGRVTWKSYRDYEFGFRMDHLSHWEVSRPPSIAWTKRVEGGIRSEDVVVMRYHDPYTFVAVVRYRPEDPDRPVDWAREVEGKGFVAAGLGESVQQRATLKRDGRAAYEVVALGPIRDRTFRFASLFIPDGKVAWRVTAGVDQKQYPRVAGTIARMLRSFTLESDPAPAAQQKRAVKTRATDNS